MSRVNKRRGRAEKKEKEEQKDEEGRKRRKVNALITKRTTHANNDMRWVRDESESQGSKILREDIQGKREMDPQIER